MKYILMMHCPQNGYESFGSWPPEAIQRHIGFMMNLNKELRESGELAGAEGLADPREAKVVRTGKDGTPVTDGVFPEAKEFLAGYWLVQVDRAERAFEIAAKASSAPDPNGEPMGIPIEVRQVMSGPPDEYV